MTADKGQRSDDNFSSNSEEIAGKADQVAHDWKESTSKGSEEAEAGSHRGEDLEKKRKSSASDVLDHDGASPGAETLRRLRRRVTNRESAKRMRLKRQGEMQAFHEQMKRVTEENEQLRKYSGYLQQQHITMASDIQHWQEKFHTANAEVDAIYQQLEQVVALSTLNPAILEQFGLSSSQAQDTAAQALLQVLPNEANQDKSSNTARVHAQSKALVGPSPAVPGVSVSLTTPGEKNLANLAAIRMAPFQNLPWPRAAANGSASRQQEESKQPAAVARALDTAPGSASQSRPSGRKAGSGELPALLPKMPGGSQAAALALAIAARSVRGEIVGRGLLLRDAAAGKSHREQSRAEGALRSSLPPQPKSLPAVNSLPVPTIAELLERAQRHGKDARV